MPMTWRSVGSFRWGRDGILNEGEGEKAVETERKKETERGDKG